MSYIQISLEAGKVVWYFRLLKSFPQFVVFNKVKGVSIVFNEADVFLKFSCFFYDLTNVGNLIPDSSAFSKTSLNIRKFTVHVLLKTWLGEFCALLY